ncbi:hypothetical protein BS50DRAFT_603216 [Corynespora cassiicola Philippines]|uniref:DUF6594 domain-containing protein n=1 Tax=Corynespora cassiicola Philippines TaxID=1448308 RepID=A0A2T2NAM6_CORCC|nr:hypothetical protein BS50DRAFT_603216 [Corynespora cassiicola Philippines]
MTGETFVEDKEMQSNESPTSPTNTENSDATLGGDAIIEIEDDSSTSRPSHVADTCLAESDEEKKRPSPLQRIRNSFKSEPEPPFVTETKTRKLEDTPNGFPRLAAFQASETNFSLYRSFSYLHARVLLDLQDEIACLERKLDRIDWEDFETDPGRLQSRALDEARARREGDAQNRRKILREIKTKLLEYDEVLVRAREVESFQKPSDRNYRSVRRYHFNTKPLMDSEMDSIRSKEDTISLHSGREWIMFDGGVENVIGRLDSLLQKIFKTQDLPLLKFFRTPELRAKTDDKDISYYSSTRIDKLINIMITFVIFVLLVIPVITMYHLTATAIQSDSSGEPSPLTSNQKNTFDAVGVLIVFTLLFSAAMSLLTKAARHELFAASAAYCAILVVFIGNFTGPGN